MSDLLASLIRTGVPYVVGAILSWVVSLGLSPDPNLEAGLTTLLTFVFGTAYYLIVRSLEQKWPWLGAFLGVPKAPAYGVGVDNGIPKQ